MRRHLSEVFSLIFKSAKSRFILKHPDKSRPSRNLRLSMARTADCAVMSERKRRQSFLRLFNSKAIILSTESSICLE